MDLEVSPSSLCSLLCSAFHMEAAHETFLCISNLMQNTVSLEILLSAPGHTAKPGSMPQAVSMPAYPGKRRVTSWADPSVLLLAR